MLRNLGIDLIKPDIHIRRILGSERLGRSDKNLATEIEVYMIANKISVETGYTLRDIDSLLWNYCAKGFGNICGAEPNCKRCVISEKCNYLA